MDYNQNPPEDEHKNKCIYCGEPCKNDFCNRECYKAELND